MGFRTLEEFLRQIKSNIVKDCTVCGSCVRGCPIIPHSKLSTHNPSALQEKVIEFLKSGNLCPEVSDRAYLCMTCEACNLLCPMGLPASFTAEIIKVELAKMGKPAPEAAAFMSPTNRYNLADILSSLQMKPAEVRWLEGVSENPKPTEVVFFLGCFAHTGPDKIFTAIDIFEQMGIEFVTLGGGVNACCGAVASLVGDVAESDRLAKKLIGDLVAFRPKTVVFWCPTCLFRLTKLFSDFIPSSIDCQHISTFWAKNLDKLHFKTEINEVVSVHDPCHLGRGVGEYESSRKLLSAIPGLRLVEMKHSKEDALCCGAGAALGDPEAAATFAQIRLNEAKECDAQTMVTLCSGCQMSYVAGEFTHGLSIKTLVELVGEAMGIRHEDKFKQLAALGDASKIIEAARNNIKAGKYSLEEMQAIVPMIFKM